MNIKNLPDTMMIWAEKDPKVTPIQDVTWATEHFTDKYGLPVTAIGVNEGVSLSELREAFPNITFYHERKAFAINQFHVYGPGVPAHKVDDQEQEN